MELANDILRLTFDDRTGSLLQIADIGAGREFLSDPRGARLLRLTIPGGDVMSRMISSHQGCQVRLRAENDCLFVEFPNISHEGHPTHVSARVKVHLPAGSWEAFFNVEIQNDGDEIVHEVVFPWIGGWTGIAGAGIDRGTASLQVFDPHKMFPRMRAWTFGRANQRSIFPSTTHQVPLFDLSGGGAGISYNLYTSTPRVFSLLAENLSPDYSNLCLSWGWLHYPYLRPGSTWKSPTVALGVHRGDWHDTADRLRQSIEQWWQPPRVPDRLRDAIGYHNIQFTGHNRERYHDVSEIPDISRDCLQWGIADLCVWDHRSQTYITYDDSRPWNIPTADAAKLSKALAEARSLGVHVSAYADFWLTTEDSRVGRDLADSFVRSFHGKPIPSNIRGKFFHADYASISHEQGGRELCQKSPRFQTYAAELVQRVLDLGFESIFIDGGSAWNLCHADNHGHESPDDVNEGALQWMLDASHAVKSHSENGYIYGEVPDSFSSQSLDMVTRWWDPNEPIAVFRYVMPQVLLPYPIDENDGDLMAKAFARGHPFATMTTNLQDALGEHPQFARRVRNFAELRKRTAAYLARGTFRDNRGVKAEGGAAFTHVSEAGIAVGIANTAAETKTLHVTLSPGELQKTPTAAGVLFHENGAQVHAICALDEQMKLAVEVPPFAAVVWCIPCQPTNNPRLK